MERSIDKERARRMLRQNPEHVSRSDRPFPTEGTIGHVCFEMLCEGTTMASLVRAIRQRRGNVKYWLWVFRREHQNTHEWRWHEDKETGEVSITQPR